VRKTADNETARERATVHRRHSDSASDDMPSAAARAGRSTWSSELSSLLSAAASSSLQSVHTHTQAHTHTHTGHTVVNADSALGAAEAKHSNFVCRLNVRKYYSIRLIHHPPKEEYSESRDPFNFRK